MRLHSEIFLTSTWLLSYIGNYQLGNPFPPPPFPLWLLATGLHSLIMSPSNNSTLNTYSTSFSDYSRSSKRSWNMYHQSFRYSFEIHQSPICSVVIIIIFTFDYLYLPICKCLSCFSSLVMYYQSLSSLFYCLGLHIIFSDEKRPKTSGHYTVIKIQKIPWIRSLFPKNNSRWLRIQKIHQGDLLNSLGTFKHTLLPSQIQIYK